jgi:hypothetical protein
MKMGAKLYDSVDLRWYPLNGSLSGTYGQSEDRGENKNPWYNGGFNLCCPARGHSFSDCIQNALKLKPLPSF